MQPEEQSREWRARVEDILDAIGRIQDYVIGLNYFAFESNLLVVDATSYRFIVIGEAVNQIPSAIQSRTTMIPWRKMRDMRNIVAHDYRGINLRIAWATISDDFGPLAAQLEALLKSEEPPITPS